MNFTYDLDRDTCFIALNNSTRIALRQEVENITVLIDGDGAVSGLAVSKPGEGPWPVRTVLERYPLDVSSSFVLVTLADRYTLFRF